MKGTLTVEASYLFPFCFWIIGVVCFLGIFIYNQAVLKMTGYECILQSFDEAEMTVLEETLLENAQKCAEERVLAVKNLEVTVKSGISKISVSYHGTQTMLNIPLEVTVVCEKIFPERTLRLIKRR